MASLLPLLYDLLPIILPSEVKVSRQADLAPFPERAEVPPFHQTHRNHSQVPGTSDGPAAESDDGSSVEPIQLLDREENARVHPSTQPCHPTLTRQASGPKVFRRDAVVGVTDKMRATVLTVEPRSATAVHHHGEQDTIVYVTKGHGVLLTSPALDPVRAIRADIKGEAPTREEEQPRRHDLSPGDFAFIPAWTEHQVVNETNEDDVVWVLVQSGGERVQVDLTGWGGQSVQQ